MKPKYCGIIWYKSEDDYKKALSIFKDSFKLPATYKDFLVGFDKAAAFARFNGMIPIKAELDPYTFSAWCEERSLNIDATGREFYANWKAREHLRKKGEF